MKFRKMNLSILIDICTRSVPVEDVIILPTSAKFMILLWNIVNFFIVSNVYKHTKGNVLIQFILK